MRRIVRLAAILNLTYFSVQFAVALAIGSVSLFADSIDFLEDTAVNFLILMALNWSARYRARMGWSWPGFCSCLEWRRFGRPGRSSPRVRHH
jgi:Co/Zn/Cd efflux system component